MRLVSVAVALITLGLMISGFINALMVGNTVAAGYAVIAMLYIVLHVVNWWKDRARG